MSPDPRIRDLASEVLAIISGVSQYAIPRFEDLFFPGATKHDDDALEMPRYGMDSPAIILHSSGVYIFLISY